MGFKFWYEAIIFIIIFSSLIAVPCFFTALIGSKMINNLGNFPTRAAKTLSDASMKVLIVEIISFVLLAAFFHIFS